MLVFAALLRWRCRFSFVFAGVAPLRRAIRQRPRLLSPLPFYLLLSSHATIFHCRYGHGHDEMDFITAAFSIFIALIFAATFSSLFSASLRHAGFFASWYCH
jgi:hypothetical protein